MSDSSAPDTSLAVEKDRVVQFHYRLFDATSGEALEDSAKTGAVAVLQGHGNVIAGIERALDGRRAGDSFEVTVSPADAYGNRRDNWTQRIAKKHLIGPKRLKVGDQAGVRTADGVRVVTVVKVGSSVVDVDLNHPMAGRTLRFEIEVTEVRAAQAEELAHGHVHGDGGHHH